MRYPFEWDISKRSPTVTTTGSSPRSVRARQRCDACVEGPPIIGGNIGAYISIFIRPHYTVLPARRKMRTGSKGERCVSRGWLQTLPAQNISAEGRAEVS